MEEAVKPRIITGKYKGKRLKVSEQTRHLTDRVKTNIFDIIGSDIENLVILDIFAGSGNFGIEALSRGALHVTFVDSSKDVAMILKQNLADCKISDKDIEVIT